MSAPRDENSNFRNLLMESHYQLRFALRKMDKFLPDYQGEHLLEWFAHLMISQGLRPLTVKSYCDSVVDFYIWINKRSLDVTKVLPNDVDEWQKSLFIERSLGAQNRMRLLTAVRRYFEWRETMGLGSSPARNIKGPKREKKLPRKFKSEDLTALFQTCGEEKLINVRDLAILIFMYSTGARREEVVNLNLDQLEIRERVGSVRFYGKGAKERMVGFEGPAVDALRRWLLELDKIKREDMNAVFVSVNKGLGTRPQNNWLDVIFKKRGKAAKLKNSTPHMMRVTFATDLYDQGEKTEIIQELMGHEDIKTTRGYLVITESRMKTRLSSSRLSQVLGKSGHEHPLWLQKKLKEGKFSENRD